MYFVRYKYSHFVRKSRPIWLGIKQTRLVRYKQTVFCQVYCKHRWPLYPLQRYSDIALNLWLYPIWDTILILFYPLTVCIASIFLGISVIAIHPLSPYTNKAQIITFLYESVMIQIFFVRKSNGLQLNFTKRYISLLFRQKKL